MTLAAYPSNPGSKNPASATRQSIAKAAAQNTAIESSNCSNIRFMLSIPDGPAAGEDSMSVADIERGILQGDAIALAAVMRSIAARKAKSVF